MEIVRTLWPRLKAQWPQLLVAGAAMLVLAGASAAYAALTGPVLKSLLGGGSIVPLPWLEKYVHIEWHYAWSIPVAIIAVAVMKGIAQAVQFSLTGRVSLKTVQGLRQELFAHLLALSPRFYGEHNTADLLSRLTNDGERVEQALFYGLAPVLRESITVAALLGFCVALDPWLSLFAFLIIPISALPLVRFSKWLKNVSRRSQDNLSDLSFTSFEALSGVRTVQAFTLEPTEMQRFAAASDLHAGAMRKSYFIRAIRTPAMEVLGAFGVAALVYFMAKGVASHALDGAHVASFAVAVVLMYEPIKKLGNVGDWFAQGAAALERMRELTHTRIEVVGGTHPPPAARGQLTFSNVSFSYRADKPVLQDLSLQVDAGSMCALVGRSGAGKSTLMQLVLRFYDPHAGEISLDGLGLTQWPLADLRQRLAWVSQDIFLFNASVRDNIAAGVDKTDAEIEAALEAAFALDFVRELPKGLDSILGERGITLSGGQRQRVAIARAFLRNSPLLLLDEATSALDTQSERMVQAALDRLMVGRTTLVIAHRLSTIERANQIAVMDAGRIIQLGTHRELLAQPGEYRALAGQA